FIASKEVANIGAIKINMPLPYSGTMADVIGKYSALFVKSYSPGNLATTSMRGMGAQHTAVLWNGINLQSIMNSNIDLNLLPVFFFDQASIETGANASSAANGAIAGAININNLAKSANRSFGEFSMGSFGQKSAAIGSSFASKKWNASSKFITRSADNNFKYSNYFIPGKPLENLKNSEFNQSGFMQDFKFIPNKIHSFYINYWYLETSRNLPSAMGITSNFNEHQDDYSHKLMALHKANFSSKVELNNKLALVNEQINYFHDLLEPAFNNANSFFIESSLKWSVNNLLDLESSISHTYQLAKTDGYSDGKIRNLIAIFSKLSYASKNKKLKLSLGSRQLMINGVMAPASPDLGAVLSLSRSLKWKSNAAAGFRVPSFNDLYWQAGGNPLLKPEMSKKVESSFELNYKNFNASSTFFLHHVNDWILWSPDPVSQLWRASNAKSVVSKGTELAAEYRMKLNQFHNLKLFGRYQLVDSRNVQVYSHDSAALFKQLFYTPNHCAFLQLVYNFKAVEFQMGSNYTGAVFTTADNDLDNQLNAYLIYNASISYRFVFKSYLSELAFKVNNLSNVNYQVMLNRPMPLRNYQFSLKFNIKYD
ncbi:MAG: TonB-dependent receptor, partial [Bacteroidia bacterium]|nr:TonB-dependent receptor [Bacteroidia bacterium]